MEKYMNKKERKRFFEETDNDTNKALRTRKLRVRVYARVSTEHESQLNALKNQIEWYNSQIYDNWEFNPDTDIYVDEGITGTLAKKRDSFMRMINDAKCDNFDIIITREVSRFARNVEETFRYTRELKEQGVGVFFINDNIWSFSNSPDGIIKLSMMASLAQGESKKTSERALAGQRVSRELGQPYGNGNILGYDRVPHIKNKDINPETGRVYRTTFTYAINEEQADTVKRIYELCLENNMGGKSIAKVLMSEGRKTATGKLKWDASNINRILNNPTYMGYNAYGKSKVVDYLSHEKQYETDLDKLELVKGDWEPIISREMWYKAQEYRAKRKVMVVEADGSKSKYGQPSDKNMWLRKLQCSCGRGYRRTKWRVNKGTGERVYSYQCWNQVNNGKKSTLIKRGLPYEDACDIKGFQESTLDLMAKKVLELVLVNRKEAVRRAIEMLTECGQDNVVDNTNKISRYKQKIAEEETSQVRAVELVTKGAIPESVLQRVLAESKEKITQYNKKIDELRNTTKSDFDKQKMLENVEKAFNTVINFDEPILDYNLIDRLVNKIIVRENYEYVWVLNFNPAVNLKPIERINHLSEEYKKTLTVDENFHILAQFEISVDEISDYHKTRGRRIKKCLWKSVKVKVAVDISD